MSPKISGIVGVALGTLLLGITYAMVTSEGRFLIIAVIGGPAFFLVGLGLVVLPVHMIVKPKEIDGSLDYGINNDTNYTPLGWALGILGFVVGAMLYGYLKFGM